MKMLEHERNKVLRGKQAPNKVLLLLLDVKKLEERLHRRCKPTGKVQRMYITFKKLKTSRK